MASDRAEPAGAARGTRHLPLRDRAAHPARARCAAQRAGRSRARRSATLLRRLGATRRGDRPLLGRLHPAGAQPAARDEVDADAGLFTVRTALLGPRANADLVLPTKPLGEMHGDAAGRVLGDRVRGSSRARRVARRARRRRDRRRRAAARERAPARRARAGARGLADRQRPPLVRPRRCSRRRSRRCSARTRTGSSTAARSPGTRPERGQYLTVVSSGVPELLEVRGRELVDRIAGQLTERLGAAELLWSRVSREPYATIALRPGVAAARRRDRAPERRARRRVDRHRLAGDDGERGAQRPRGRRSAS